MKDTTNPFFGHPLYSEYKLGLCDMMRRSRFGA